ncbi:GQ67_00517T0 [Komagataella phaffii]|nr:GQ67_00517T0 [Komagataella phaffii]AOA67316.1 GQ68_00871T0 [Komagataella phaffii GS115]
MPKTIILCVDGTKNQFQTQPFTNVMKFYRMLYKEDPSTQLCYYQPGIGSVEAEFMDLQGYVRKIPVTINAEIDSMVAHRMDQHIVAAYKFLVQYYSQGDKIFLFGFR